MTYSSTRATEPSRFHNQFAISDGHHRICLKEHIGGLAAQGLHLQTVPCSIHHHIILQPQPDHRQQLPVGQEFITSAAARHQSYYGDILSAWQTADQNGFTYECTVPANTTATLYLPAGSEQTSVYEGDRPAAESEGVEYLGYEDGCQVYRLGSGSYCFNTDLKDAISRVVTESSSAPVYDLNGRLLRSETTSTQGLRAGIYIAGGRKVMTR